MHRTAAPLFPALNAEAESVLAALAHGGPEAGHRLNDLSAATGLPTGHVGRHLRTLERERLVRYGAGAWRPTERGARHAADVAPEPEPEPAGLAA